MQRKNVVNLGNLLLSLSEAMDLAGPVVAQHQQRVAFIALEMSKAAGLPEKQRETLFTAALLHDIGAMSVEEKISLMRFDEDEEEHENHCILGARLLEKVPLLSDTAGIIRNHHKKWQDYAGSIDDAEIQASQIILLADRIDRLIQRNQFILHQHEEIIGKAKSLMGTAVHSTVVHYFLAAAGREEFWLDLVSPRLYPLLLHCGPCRNREIEIEEILSISELFRNIIDFRSRFTATHTAGVTTCAEMVAGLYGLTDSEAVLMKIAGNLHDLGKLCVPNFILEKPGTLTPEEFAIMKGHTYYTYHIINTIGGLKDIAEWAAYHHEKMDGSGYPFHHGGEKLTAGSRIMAVADIFTAISEDRPYRSGMEPADIIDTMNLLSTGKLLDPRVVSVLLDNFEPVYTALRSEQSRVKEFFETQFLIK